MTYNYDVAALAEAQDARAQKLLREGLDSPYPNVVGFAVEGLGRLQDIDAIPLIERACARLPAAKGPVAIALPWYSRPEADALMERLEPDRKRRDFHVAQVKRMRDLEARTTLSRRAAPTPK